MGGRDGDWRRQDLAATLPAAVAVMIGIPTHILTVNDYLANRDVAEMGHQAIGFNVGMPQEKQTP